MNCAADELGEPERPVYFADPSQIDPESWERAMGSGWPHAYIPYRVVGATEINCYPPIIIPPQRIPEWKKP